MNSTEIIIWFIAGSFAISLIAFVFMLLIPSAQSPEGFPGLPIWFLAVWSPSITAFFIAVSNGMGRSLLKKLVNVEGIGPAVLIGLVPLAIFAGVILLRNQQANWSNMPPKIMVTLVLLNLFLGPLGEELGWRGLLQPGLSARFGWLGASLIVGVVWALWHAPLWLIDSPQRQISFVVFFGHVMAYSVLMGAAWTLAPNSLLPAVFLHLLFNVVSGAALVIGVAETAEWYRITTIPYCLGAAAVGVIVQVIINSIGIGFQSTDLLNNFFVFTRLCGVFID